MKTIALPVVLFLVGVTAQSALAAEPFTSGSTGVYGPMNITQETTLDLPPDGVFHCTTITVAQGATLRFNRNPLNTPVYLLATGDVDISGDVDASGKTENGQVPGQGGPGGFNGGWGGSQVSGQEQAGDGEGPGGGRRAQPSANFAGLYGNLLLSPLVGGSGGFGQDGTPGYGGTGGGGAVLMASNTRLTIGGSVTCRGGNQNQVSGCLGSGGAIRLVAPMVTGTGTLDVSGGVFSGSGWFYTGGKGRIRIDCTDNQAYRSLDLVGVASRGSRMIVFPAVIPALDIIEVAGNPIPVGTNAPALFELPVGAPTNQTVKIQARDFTGDVPIRVVVTPEHGSAGAFDATILQSSGNPPFASVPVIIPAGSVCQIHAWTR